MFSYIFMKILEKRPERYDTGINILSGGHAKKIRKQIVQNYVKPGMEILDIGCGTGSLIIDAAKAGARTTGVDISTGMLLGAKTVDSHPNEVLDLLAAATADLFQGPNVVAIENLFKRSRGTAADTAHYFQEMIVQSLP